MLCTGSNVWDWFKYVADEKKAYTYAKLKIYSTNGTNYLKAIQK